MDEVPQLNYRSGQLQGSYGDYKLNPNALSAQYGGSVPQVPGGSAPGFLSQFWSALNGAGVMSPLMNMLTGGVGGLISTGLNLFTQNWQNNQAIDMWNMENEYNTPQNQLQRFLDAGINPAQAVAAVTSGQSTAGSLQPGQNPSQAPDLMSMMGNSANNSLGQELMVAQIEKTNAESELVKSQNIGKKIENKYADAEHDAVLKKLLEEGRIAKSTANMLAQDEFYHGAEAFQHWQQTMLNTATMVQELQNLGQDYINKLAEYEVFMSQAGLNNAQIQKVWSDIGLNNAMIQKINAQTRSINAETAAIWQNIQINDIRKQIDQITLAFKQNDLKILQNYGYDVTKPVNYNYLMLCAQGKKDEANELMGNVYQYVTGTEPNAKYAGQENARKWVSTITGGLMTVGGIIMMATGAGAVPGAALTAGGLTTMSKSMGPVKQPGNSAGYDFSHLPTSSDDYTPQYYY